MLLPSSATAEFKRFFDCGRAVRCLHPLGAGRFMHLFFYTVIRVLMLMLSSLLRPSSCLMLPWVRLAVVARGQPCWLVGDFNVEPTKIPCLAKGISAGLWVDFEEAWALAAGVRPAHPCKRSWTAAGGHRRDFMVGCPLAAAAAVLSCRFSLIGGLHPILRFGLFLTIAGGNVGLRSLFSALPFGLLLGCLLLIRVGIPSRLRFRGFGRFYDERLQFMSRQDASLLDESHVAGDVSRAWLVWSRAAEAALADAFRFSGGPLPSGGLVLGRGGALFRVGRLGGHQVREARANVADALDAADVFLYRVSSKGPLLDMRRRFKAVVDVLGVMICSGVSLSRSVELTVQWDRILALGPLYPVTLDDHFCGSRYGHWCIFSCCF